MRAGINCGLANRQILTHLTHRVFAHFFPRSSLPVLFDVSHNTCKEEEHEIAGERRRLFVHRKGATRAFGAGHRDLPPPSPPPASRSSSGAAWAPIGDHGRIFAAAGARLRLVMPRRWEAIEP